MLLPLALSVLLQGTALAEGRRLYALHCATCHGADLHGSSQGPPLNSVDAIDVDFMLSTGRMPASIPYEQEMHQNVQWERSGIAPDQIGDVVQYVMSQSSGDKTLPNPPPGLDNAPPALLRRGLDVFTENCEQCHSASGHGDSVGFQNVAPDLMDADARQIAEAVRMGPDVMPQFGPKIISDADLNALIAYVKFLQHGQYNPGGLQLANIGPVAEGFIGWTFGIGLLVLLARRIGTTE